MFHTAGDEKRKNAGTCCLTSRRARKSAGAACHTNRVHLGIRRPGKAFSRNFLPDEKSWAARESVYVFHVAARPR
jgi:hypothetical protein